jgi:hypothetical protein
MMKHSASTQVEEDTETEATLRVAASPPLRVLFGQILMTIFSINYFMVVWLNFIVGNNAVTVGQI